MNIKLSIPEGFLQDEVRENHYVSESMKRVWAVELDLINELLRVCEKYNLKIYCCAGTILGAVRHGGYIPWDDDVDMMMYRNDYDKLCSVCNQEFTDPYFFQTEQTDPGSVRGHAQLRNSTTTAILNTEKGKKVHFNQGIFIDIFPLDSFPDLIEERKTLMEQEKKRLRYARWLLNGPSESERTMKREVKHLAYLVNKIIPMGKLLYKKFEKDAQKYNQSETKHVGIVALGNERFVWRKDDIDKSVLMKFEMLEVPVPVKYDALLKKTYGDWKTPVKGGSVHGDVFFDTEKSYKDYIQ